MKRGIKLVVALFFLIVLLVSVNSAVTITGDATSSVAINITVTSSSPNISFTDFSGGTYISNSSLSFNFSATNQQTVWYNIDGGENITMTGPVDFDISEGTHIIFIFANNSNGIVTSYNMTFTVNSSIFVPVFSKWQGSKKGNSTNFYKYNFDELENLEDVIFEHTDFGKINFLGAINLSNDNNPGDYEIDLDKYINLSFNRIELDSDYLPNFNKSATLIIRNLTLTNPRIAMNGVVCPTTTCIKQSYSNGLLTFNVTHFSIFSAEETPVGSGSSGSSGGGGGSGAAISNTEVYISPDNIKTSLKQGQTVLEELTIKNIGTTTAKLTLAVEKVDDLVRLSDTNIELTPGESKTINIDIIARRDTIPDLYLGKLFIKGAVEEEILLAIEVESEKSLFDVNVEIPRRFLFIDPGKELIANVKLSNFGGIIRTDIHIDYEIRDEEGNVILKESETVAVETQSSLSKIFEIPKHTPTGDYVLYVKTTTPEGEIASATAWFSVGKIPLSRNQVYLYLLGIIITIVILFILYELQKIKKHVGLGKISGKDLIKRGYIKKSRPEGILRRAFKNR